MPSFESKTSVKSAHSTACLGCGRCGKGPIVTDQEYGEIVCASCGFVVEEYLEAADSFDAKSSILTCDENRLGSNNISPDNKNLKLNRNDKLRLSAREKPQRKNFNDACSSLGFPHDSIRVALHYFDLLHKIRTEQKMERKRSILFADILNKLENGTKMSDIKTSRVIQAMLKTHQKKNQKTCENWITKMSGVETLPAAINAQNCKVLPKPKKLSTPNISFFSIFQVACDHNILVTEDQITSAIAEYMGFVRQVKNESALNACKTALTLEKNAVVKTPANFHDVMMVGSTIESERTQYLYNVSSHIATTKKDAQELKGLMELIS